MQVFLSYSHADKNLAAKLRRSLEEMGLSFNDPGENAHAGDSWRRQLEGAIRSSDAILLLLSSRQRGDEQQQLTWRLALEAVWADPTKCLVPILLQDAELPAFVRSGASGDSVLAIRIRELEDLRPAIQAILQTLYIQDKRNYRNYGWLRSGLLYPHESYPAVTDEDRVQRRERLSAIRQYAEQLKN